jgi:hypothetical protein
MIVGSLFFSKDVYEINLVLFLIAFDSIFLLVVLVHYKMELTLDFAHAEVSDKATHKAFTLVRKTSSI